MSSICHHDAFACSRGTQASIHTWSLVVYHHRAHAVAHTLGLVAHTLGLFLPQRRHRAYTKVMTAGMTHTRARLFRLQQALMRCSLWLAVTLLACAEKLHKWRVH